MYKYKEDETNRKVRDKKRDKAFTCSGFPGTATSKTRMLRLYPPRRLQPSGVKHKENAATICGPRKIKKIVT